MLSVGAWVGQQIEDGVGHRTAATTALYVDSIIAPDFPGTLPGATLTPEHQANLDRLLKATAFGQRIAAFKVWTEEGRIVYSPDAVLIGQIYAVEGELALFLPGRSGRRHQRPERGRKRP